ncbi:MAG: AbrB family transcriptional regulator, partial [Hyphomicrobiaceae bacterium]
GASFSPDLMSKAWGTMLSLALMIPYTLLITGLGMLLLAKAARFDLPTAFFSAAPGGLADMLIFAQDAGADLRRVSLIQAARVVSILCVLPFWLQYVAGLPLGGAAPQALHIWQIGLIDAATIVLIAWTGWWIAGMLGMSGGSIVGPLILSAVLHVASVTTVKVPVEVLILTQISVGLAVGAQFKGISLREFATILSWGFVFGMGLVLIAGGMAVMVASLTGLDATALLLSYAPGGQNEMAIIALILGIDVAVIALHHLLRVVMVIVGAQVVFRMAKSWRAKGR